MIEDILAELGVPQPGWPGRRRALAIAWAKLTLLVVGVAIFLAAARLAIIVVWAASL